MDILTSIYINQSNPTSQILKLFIESQYFTYSPMFPQPEGGEEDRKFEYGQDLEQEVTDYSHVTKHPYTNKIFCWIEAGDTKQVINFFNTFPHLINQFATPNNWNPFMYAVRYGNLQLIDYFTQKQMKINVNSIFNQVSMIHSAVYSTDVKILKYVLDTMKCSPNPPNSEISPLKIAMKIGNAKMVELLICKGAYYVFGDVYNNIEPKHIQTGDENAKYTSLVAGKDVVNSAVVEDTAIKDCSIKETLRWARIRQLMFLQACSKKHEQGEIQHKFDAMSKILSNQHHYASIIKMCIGSGDSITKSNEVNEEPKEREEKRQTRK